MSNFSKLQDSLARIDSLPAMPAIAQKLLTLPLDTYQGEAEMLKLIAQDPQISAKIIGLSNTSLFFAPGKITSVSDAAMRLGLNRVKSVAIGISTMSALAKLPEGKLSTTDLWAHSMAIAMSMRVIAKHMPVRVRPSDDQIFLAGLLHDIGYMALSYLDTNLSDSLHARLEAESDSSLLEIENEVLGIQHGEIGAILGTHWHLPDEVIAVMRYHHTPDEPKAAVSQPLVSMVNYAERILSAFGVAENTAKEMTDEEWMGIGVDPSKAETIQEEILEVADQAKQLASSS